ncbi:LysR substrate-binding domain-containing protein [Hyphomicrobium sp.]|uniref:LysR substrate-binding domain-containing protein n=1 Tax=Hyphomicrobium sp. TaxID=82 RepID=UPI0025C154DE|nr:LysR substrate-binding domain-containing protein [Hyphomicrobium sp.]
MGLLSTWFCATLNLKINAPKQRSVGCNEIPRMRTLPPLNPLRAFEAAARHKSIRKAAEELGVTSGAVSRQVKVLEEFLGIAMFRRSPSEVILTAEGEQYFQIVTVHLHALAEGTNILTGYKDEQIVRIRAYTTFAAKWLIPRTKSFYLENPNTELRLTTSLEGVDFERENIDAAIRLCDGSYPGCEIDRLVANDLTPLCSPQYAAEHGLRTGRDLARVRFLHTVARPDDWRLWIEAAGLTGVVDAHGGPKFASSLLAYQAAMGNQGVLLGPIALFRDDIQQGTLVQVCDPVVSRGNFTYYFVYPRSRLRNPALRRFRSWLLRQIEDEMGLDAKQGAKAILQCRHDQSLITDEWNWR